MTPASRPRVGDGPIALALGIGSFALYAATAAPSVATVFDDSLELQVVVPTLSLAHPSGYPLYTLAGKAFTLLMPFRDPAGRLNLFSALCAAAAVAVLFLLARKIAGSRPAALVATTVFAISPAWWGQATIAEVYSLHCLLVAAFLWFLLLWEEALPAGRPGARMAGSAPGIGQRADRYLAAAALVFGLGLAHHRMIALMAPAALVFVLWTDPSLLRTPRRWIAPVSLVLAPLLLYLFLPWLGRSGSLDGAYRATLSGTLDWITARGYSVFLTGNPFGVERDAGDSVRLIQEQLGIPLVLAALFGLYFGWRMSRRRFALLLLATAAQLAFASAYKVQDVEVFFLPALMLIAVWGAWGMAPLFDAVTQQVALWGRSLGLPRRAGRMLVALAWIPVALVMLFSPVGSALSRSGELDRSDEWDVHDYGGDIVASVAPGGRVVGLLGETTLVRYVRDVLGQRPDLAVTAADAEPARLAAVENALAAGEPVYLTRDLPGAAQRFSLDAAGPLVRVSPKVGPGPAPAGHEMGAGIRMVGGQAVLRPARAGCRVRIEADWTATGPISEALKVSARLLDGAGQPVAAQDVAPVHFTYPTTAWIPGETVHDVYDLELTCREAAGPYTPLLVLYRSADGSEIGRAELQPVELRQSADAGGHTGP